MLINKKKKKKKGQIFKIIFLIFYLTCFTPVPIFKSIGPLVAEIWGGGGQNSPPPSPPMDSSPQNNPMGLGLMPLRLSANEKTQVCKFYNGTILLTNPYHAAIFQDKDSKFRLILIESRIHRLARYYKTKRILAPNWK